MHSSRMHTTHALTVSPSMLCAGGCTWSGGVPGLGVEGTWSQGGGVPGLGVVPGPGGAPGPGGTWSWGMPGLGGVPGPGGRTWSWECLVLGGVPGPGGVCLVWGLEGTWSEGVYLVGGVPGLEGVVCLVQRVYLVWGVYWSGTPPVDRITDACKNITLPQLHCGR